MNFGRIKALIYRELVISRKFYITAFSSFLGVALIGFLVNLSAEIGNIGKIIESSEGADGFIGSFIYYTFVYCTGFVSGVFVNTSDIFIADIRSRWRTFAFALPATPSERSAAKTIIVLCSVIVSTALGILNYALLAVVTGRELEFSVVKIIFAETLFYLFSNLINMIFLATATNEKEANRGSVVSTSIYMTAFFGALLLLKKVGFVDSSFEDMAVNFSSFFDSIQNGLNFVIPAIVVLIVAYYFICMKSIGRRDK